MFRRAVDLFTPDEHAVLAQWFKTEPPDIAKDIVPEEAAGRLGFNICHIGPAARLAPER